MKRFDTNFKMGLFANNPREFNIDKKLRLQDPLKLLVDNKLISHSIRKWIDQDPVRIWIKLFQPSKYYTLYNITSGKECHRISLCSNSYAELSKVIKMKRPDLFREKELRKNLRRQRKLE
jgi:hypothetical protein